MDHEEEGEEGVLEARKVVKWSFGMEVTMEERDGARMDEEGRNNGGDFGR